MESRPAELRARFPADEKRRYLGPSMGDQYVEDGDDDSIAFSMEPQRWSSVDYGGAE
ncbi:MAG: hypothetical protein R2710_17445 [Acidimicrobiales bacterium]